MTFERKEGTLLREPDQLSLQGNRCHSQIALTVLSSLLEVVPSRPREEGTDGGPRGPKSALRSAMASTVTATEKG